MIARKGLRTLVAGAFAGVLLFFAGLFGGGCAGTPGMPAPSTVVLTDLNGVRAPTGMSDDARVAVYVFLGVECPIANRCLPELTGLEAELGKRGVRFFHLYPNEDEMPERIRRHRSEYGLGPLAYRDPGMDVARALGAHATPEVVALTREGALIYRGRVNDQYGALGVGRPDATRHDLAEALRSYLDGAPPAGLVTPTVGCTFRAAP